MTGFIVRRFQFWLALGLNILCSVRVFYALDPARALSQYVRNQWGPESGIPPGSVYAITQTKNGYLWIGTDKGLVRFDGQSFVLIQNRLSTEPVRPVLGLTADQDGSLWIRLRQPTLLHYQQGKFENAMPLVGQPDSVVSAIAKASNGALLAWVTKGEGSVITQRDGRFQTFAGPGGRAKSPVLSLAETPQGEIWIGTWDAGLFRLNGSQSFSVREGLPDSKINCLLATSRGDVWVGTDNGAARWNGQELTQSGVPPVLRHTRILAMAADRDSNVWVGTNSEGLIRVDRQGTASMEETGHRRYEAVTALFEDREGDLWVGRASSIERIRDSPFVTYAQAQGVPSAGALYADSRNRIWFAPLEGGLCWLEDGQHGCLNKAEWGRDVVYAVSGGPDGLWVGKQHGGLTHLRFNDRSLATDTYTEAQGLAQNSIDAVHESRNGAIWAGTLSGGVTRLYGQKLTTYTTATGLRSNTVAAISESADGTIWLGTLNGLSAFSNGRWHTYAIQDGLPSENVNCLFNDSQNVLWIGTAAGLAFRNGDRIRDIRTPPLRDSILGMAQDRKGWLWITTSNRVLQVCREKLLRGTLTNGDWREYGIADGLGSVEGIRRHHSVVSDRLGRIWFSLNGGLSVVDPARLIGGAVPTIAEIQTIQADGNSVDPQGHVRIPPRRQRVRFGYAGLNLSLPERVRFRYILEGFDQNWSEPVSTREAIYTNLSPGPYRFRVIASDPNGFWNGREAVLPFEVEPAFWQTWWFRSGGVLAFAAAMIALYRLRLRQLTYQLNIRFEERLAERTRIAQELHDTLLQGFLSVSMQLHVAADQFPPDSQEKRQVSRVLQLMTRVIEEGRSAVRGLRSPHKASLDLVEAFSQVQHEYAGEGVGFRLSTDGPARPLHPLIRDEVYRIGREALVNAFRHSGATHIEAEVRYTPRHLRVLVRDNGSGIDPQVLRSGREGHWGLPGMRERAEKIGAQIHLWSGLTSGTEVELSVPAHIAFEHGNSNRTLRWSARFQRWRRKLLLPK